MKTLFGVVSFLFPAFVLAAGPTIFRDSVFNGSVGIGGTAAANSKSVLDIKSTTKGLLIPRMTTTQKNAISSPTTGLIVYDTTVGGLYQYDGLAWELIASDGLTPNFSSLTVGSSTATGTLVASSTVQGTQLISTISTGTAPLTVASTTQVANLKAAFAGNADTVTTNANLTGAVTSSGNATTYAGTVPLNKGGTGQTTKAAAFDALSPMTTSGDIIYGGASGTGTRLAKQNDGDVLTLASGIPSWATPGGGAGSAKNYLINSGFNLWQRGTALTIATGSGGYEADRWWANVAIGAPGDASLSQIAGTTAGSKYAARLQITTGGSAYTDLSLSQFLDNLSTLELLGKSISWGALIKATGNVTQVGVSFVYATSEVYTNTLLGSETLVTVNSSTFTASNVLSQPVSSTPTTAGIVGVRVRITAVSSGDLFDLNNGFIIEQAMMNTGATLGSWVPAGATSEQEIAMAQRFYEKSYDITVDPASNTFTGIMALGFTSGGTIIMPCIYKVRKRAIPTFTIYNPVTGTVSQVRGLTGTGNYSASTSFSVGETSTLVIPSVTITDYYGLQWTADAEIY